MSNSLISQSYLLRAVASSMPHLGKEQKERFMVVGKVYTNICRFIESTFSRCDKDFAVAEVPLLGKVILNSQSREVTF